MKRNNNNPPDEQPDPKRQKTVQYDQIASNVANMALRGVIPTVSMRNKLLELNEEVQAELTSENYKLLENKKRWRGMFYSHYIMDLAEYLDNNLQWGLSEDDLENATIPYIDNEIRLNKRPPDPDKVIEHLESDVMVKIYNQDRYRGENNVFRINEDSKNYFQLRQPIFGLGPGGTEVYVPKNSEILQWLDNEIRTHNIDLRGKARDVSKAFSLLWGRAVDPEDVWRHFASRVRSVREKETVLNDLQLMDSEPTNQ